MESHKIPEIIYSIRNEDDDYFGRIETGGEHEGVLWFGQ